MTKPERVRVLLSLQRALLGSIIAQVRAVDVCWNESEIRIRFAVDGREDPRLEEILTDVETEVLADFVPDADVSIGVERIDSPLPISEFSPFQGECARVFARLDN